MREFFLICLILIGTRTAQAYTAEDCIRCHGEHGTESVLHVSVDGFQRSAHGRTGMVCTDCHMDVQGEKHQSTAGSTSVSCTGCHALKNMHGIGSDRCPECYSCHTKHHILEKDNIASSVHPASLHKTCSACHPLECGESDYLSWLPSIQIVSHGKQDFSKVYARDNCIGCHQGLAAHGEKGVIDGQNCYRCHQSMMGYMHPKADREKSPSLFAAAIIYQMLLAVLLPGGCAFYLNRFSGIKKGKRVKG
jgi:hypothetical protein